MLELVQAKIEGGEAFTAEEQPAELDETEDVSDLLAKLEASVAARKGGSDDKPTKKAPEKEAVAKKAPAKKAVAKKTPAKKAPTKRAAAKK
jgi:DNA end-binding protein Ku